MIRQRLLLDDGVIAISEVRCSAAPGSPSGEEVVDATEINLPLGGLFVRTVRRAGGVGAPRASIGDPTRAMLFRRGEPYRVDHPIRGDDRTLVLALRQTPSRGVWGGADDRSVPPAITIAGRRLANALIAGAMDDLAAVERAMTILRALGLEGGPPEPAGTDRERRLGEHVRLEVATRLGERLTLAELGRSVGLSGWELARRFRRATGSSIHAYRTRLRVQAALERVEQGERDLTALALDLGFADHSHMTNVVRRVTGLAPSAYRTVLASSSRGAPARTNLQA